MSASLLAQRRVDPKNTYTRVICVVPLETHPEGNRPKYAPAPPTGPNQAPPGIVAWMQQVSDDGKSALVEFVAKNPAALAPILNDKTIKAFVKGKDKKSDIESELKKYKKDFSLDSFGVVVP